ncbi:MAG TPA: hypothetical protein DCE41_07255 [Cytophagales bacterium]|nr:hypothetical protein [Cytophagales bacterium]HAA19598.1 hypothetical protein [Cytophagales bacterium]HAP60266.1 hypothetical protein [Cytophagales bacterium]
MVKIFSSFGTCNGTLLNTTREDGRQLVLSARHCFPDNFGRLAFIFNQDYLVPAYEIERSVWETSDYLILAESKDLDFVLFEVTEPIPQFVTPYYAGWNAQAGLPLATHGLYIIEEEILEVVDVNMPRLATLPVIAEFGGIPITNSMFWIQDWEEGYTQVGASGSPIYDQWGLLKGTLTAGQSTPSAPVNDFYSRVDFMYDYYDTPATSLQSWIDPLDRADRWLPGDEPALSRYVSSDAPPTGPELVAATTVSEYFRLDTALSLYGLYLPVSRGVDRDTMEISVLVGEEVVYNLAIRSEAILNRLENFVDLLIPIELENDFEVRVTSSQMIDYVTASLPGNQISVEGNRISDQTLYFDLLVGSRKNDIPEWNDSAIIYYPNPFEDNLWVEGDFDPETAVFYSSRGQIVYPEYTYDFRGRLLYSFNSLPGGVYFLVHPDGTIPLFHTK